MSSNDTLIGTLFEILPGLNKLVAGLGLVIVGIFGILPQATGVPQEEPFTPIPGLIRPFNIVEGNTNSNVTVIEFIDYQCPACKAAEPVTRAIVEEYKQDIKFVHKMYPLEAIHANARISALGALAANKQGKFTEYVERLFASQDNPGLSQRTQEQIATELGLDMNRWNTDRRSTELANQVKTDQKDGQTASLPVSEGSNDKTAVDGTPTFVFIKDGQILYKKSSMSAEDFRANLNKLLGKSTPAASVAPAQS